MRLPLFFSFLFFSSPRVRRCVLERGVWSLGLGKCILSLWLGTQVYSLLLFFWVRLFARFSWNLGVLHFGWVHKSLLASGFWSPFARCLEFLRVSLYTIPFTSRSFLVSLCKVSRTCLCTQFYYSTPISLVLESRSGVWHSHIPIYFVHKIPITHPCQSSNHQNHQRISEAIDL